MRTRLSALLIVAVVAITACVPLTPVPIQETRVVRFGFPTAPDTGDVPALLAQEMLKTQGYTVQVNSFENPEIEAAALTAGDLDFGHGSTRTHWAAAQKGADIVTLMEQSATVWYLVTRQAIETCEELEAKRMGVQSAGSISNALLQVYLRQHCPDTTPELLFVAGSDNRAVALQANELDGAMLEVEEVVQLDRTAPGQFHTLIDFRETLPGLKTTAIYTSKRYAQANPQIVRDYVRAVLTVNRSLREDRTILYDALQKYLRYDAERAKEVGDIYLDANVWDLNGGLTLDDVKYSLGFFVEAGSLPEGLDAEDATDPSFLDAVLLEIGRK